MFRLIMSASLLAMALLLAACQMSPSSVPAAPAAPIQPYEAFSASGNEPFWRIDASDHYLLLRTPEQEIRFQLTARTENASQWQAGQHSLTLHRQQHLCHDTMTGMPYPERVMLNLNGQRLVGCGGEPESLFAGKVWRVMYLDGEPLVSDSQITLDFTEPNRIAGTAGCNRYFAGYQLTGEGLQFSQAGATRMACDEARNQQEYRFLQLLDRVYAFDLDPEGHLLLLTTDNQQIKARTP